MTERDRIKRIEKKYHVRIRRSSIGEYYGGYYSYRAYSQPVADVWHPLTDEMLEDLKKGEIK